MQDVRTCMRPAVSISTTSKPLFRAKPIAGDVSEGVDVRGGVVASVVCNDIVEPSV